MAVRALTPIGQILKWVLVPAALAVTGYYLLGPRLDNLLPSGRPGVVLPAQAIAPEVKVKEPPVPEVEVKARPSRRTRTASSSEEPKPERVSKRRERQNPVPIQTERERRPDQAKKENPAQLTGEGVSSEDPNAVDPVQKAKEEPPKENPDPASTGGGTGEATGVTPP